MQVGQQVSARHYEKTFFGIIESKRALTVKTDGCFEYFIRTANGSLELIWAKWDGQPSSYNKFSDSLEAA